MIMIMDKIDDDNEFFLGYFSIPLENIWTLRNVKPPKDDDPASQWILDSVNGANDTCTCAHPILFTLI